MALSTQDITRMSPLLHADVLRYIREGIRIARADYPHQSRKAFRSTMQTISITRASTSTITSVSRTIYDFKYILLHCCIAAMQQYPARPPHRQAVESRKTELGPQHCEPKTIFRNRS